MVAIIDVLAWDDEPTDQDRERFRVDNDDKATWAMRKASAASARLDEIHRIAVAEIERIQRWSEQESRSPQRDLEYFEAVLVDYAMRQRAEGRKTVSTPYGAVKSRAGQVRISVSDKEQFLAWARQNRPEWVAVKEEPSMAAIKESGVTVPADPKTGEIIPGLDVEPPSITYKVEVQK